MEELDGRTSIDGYALMLPPAVTLTFGLWSHKLVNTSMSSNSFVTKIGEISLIRPPDMHVGGLTFYHGFFLLLLFLFAL